jgi:cytochrome b pre-mRNA-processing protein 3
MQRVSRSAHIPLNQAFERPIHLILSKLFGRKRQVSDAILIRTYEAIVAAARQTVIYSEWNVPDTPLGRFESLTMHMILFLRRTKDAGSGLPALGQEVVEEFFKDVDHSLRELGIGDVSVPKRMKRLARMFYGRAASYDGPIGAGDAESLSAALTRNVFPEAGAWPQAIDYALHALAIARSLDEQTDRAILAGDIKFPQSPAAET